MLFVCVSDAFCCLQQLAALLISRQVIGNLKESALPYIVEHMRLAKMSFDLWGALSPQNSRPPPGTQNDKKGDATNEGKDKEEAEQLNKRTMSQAELESSLFKVRTTEFHKFERGEPSFAIANIPKL